MSYYRLPDGFASDSPLIKADDRTAFADAVALLSASQARSEALATTEAEAQANGYADGLAQGLADAEQRLAAETAKLVNAVDAIRRDYTARVAEAAHAATIAIIGTLDDANIVNRIVAQQLAQRDDTDGLVLTVHDAAPLKEALGKQSAIDVIADSELPSTACRLSTREGRIVADLSLQLNTLRQRWGLADGNEAS